MLRSTLRQPSPVPLEHSKFNRVELSHFAGWGDCIRGRNGWEATEVLRGGADGAGKRARQPVANACEGGFGWCPGGKGSSGSRWGRMSRAGGWGGRASVSFFPFSLTKGQAPYYRAAR